MAAVTIAHFFLLMLVSGFLYLVFILITGIFGDVQNLFLDIYPGAITEQTIVAGNFVIGVILAAPFLVAVALFIWAVTKGASSE